MPALSLSHYYRTKGLMGEKRDNFLRLVLSSLNVPVLSGTSPGHGANGTTAHGPLLGGAGEKNRRFRVNEPCLIYLPGMKGEERRKGPLGAAGGTSRLGLGWRSTTSSTWATGMCGWTRAISIPIAPGAPGEPWGCLPVSASSWLRGFSPLSLCHRRAGQVHRHVLHHLSGSGL